MTEPDSKVLSASVVTLSPPAEAHALANKRLVPTQPDSTIASHSAGIFATFSEIHVVAVEARERSCTKKGRSCPTDGAAVAARPARCIVSPFSGRRLDYDAAQEPPALSNPDARSKDFGIAGLGYSHLRGPGVWCGRVTPGHSRSICPCKSAATFCDPYHGPSYFVLAASN